MSRLVSLFAYEVLNGAPDDPPDAPSPTDQKPYKEPYPNIFKKVQGSDGRWTIKVNI